MSQKLHASHCFDDHDRAQQSKIANKTSNIFLFLGTGFLGRVLVEKILRVTEVGKLYLVIRSKKGIDPKDRIVKLIDDPVSVHILDLECMSRL